MIKNKIIALMLIIIVMSQLMHGCSSDSNVLTANGILDTAQVEILKNNINMYENEDGGFCHYYNSEISLYYTYHYLNVLGKFGDIDLKTQKNARVWLDNVEMYYFTNNDAFLVLNNIYYYLSIAKLANYDIPKENYNTIINTLESLYDNQGFYLTILMKEEDTSEFLPVKILANTRGIEIFILLNKEVPNKEYIEKWCYRLIEKTCATSAEKIGNIGPSIYVLNMLGISPIRQNQQIKESFDSYTVPDEVVFIDLYYLFNVNKYLKDQEIVDSWKLDYNSKINSYISENVFVFDDNKGGNILFTDLAMDMDSELNKSISWDSTLETIRKKQLSNGSFSDSVEKDSEMVDTFYAYKCLKILGLDFGHKKSLNRYLSSVEEYYSDYGDYEKILYLDMKYDLGKSNSNDLEKVNSLIQTAYSHDVEKNYFFINHLLTVCNKYDVKANSDYIKKIEAFISDKISKKYDLDEDSIATKLLAYEIATKIDSQYCETLKSEISNEFQMNYSKYENIDAIVAEMLVANIQLMDEIKVNSLRDSNGEKIDYNITHHNLNLKKEGERGFYIMYVTLVILSEL